MIVSANFERLVLGCIDADFFKQLKYIIIVFIIIFVFQHLSRSTKCLYLILKLVNPVWKTMKSASGKRHPDEAHGAGEETSRPQQCSEAWGSREKRCTGHAALTVRVGTALIQDKR